MGLPDAAKTTLRKEIKNILKSMSTENRFQQSSMVTKKVLEHSYYQKADRISIYLNMETEVNTMELLETMFSQNKQVFVPSYRGSMMEMIKINGLDDYNSLPLTKWNIKQPNDDGTRENAIQTGGLDLILVPGVAFTRNGARMGHGMGYYDKYFDRLIKIGKRPTLIGLAFKEQIVNDMPQSDHDITLDVVLTSDE